jgi:hypothetical protein
LWRKSKHVFFFEAFLSGNGAVGGGMLKDIVEEPGRRQMTLWGMRIACWIPKSKNTHSEYAILIAFVLRQWLQERV